MKILICPVHNLVNEGFHRIPGREIAIRQIADDAVLRKKARYHRISSILFVPVCPGTVDTIDTAMIAPAVTGNRPFSRQVIFTRKAEVKFSGVVVQADGDIHLLFNDIQKIGMPPVYVLCIHENSPV